MKKALNLPAIIRKYQKSREMSDSWHVIKHGRKSGTRSGGMSGFGTVEIVLIIAVLISLALLFRSAITSYATHLITSVFGDQSVLSTDDEGDLQP